MEIRQATDKDIPAIVALLKLSLGESLMPKSEVYWRWKHVDNPFGISPVLVGVDSGTIVGVRAFMRWQWINQRKVYHAIRAVDTATHPEHQGRGIFKKLTLSLVELCKQQGVDFIFNTPNAQSKNGYLKMGWEQAGRIPVRLSLQRPITLAMNIIAKKKKAVAENMDPSLKYFFAHPQLPSLIDNHFNETKQIVTNLSVDYLNWRYINVPVANYVALGSESGKDLTGLMIGRIKDNRMGKEFRITDYFFSNEGSRDEVLGKLKDFRKTWNIDYTTVSGTLFQKPGKSAMRFPSFNVPVGPIVTIRPLLLKDLGFLKRFSQWAPSLGDLELF